MCRKLRAKLIQGVKRDVKLQNECEFKIGKPVRRELPKVVFSFFLFELLQRTSSVTVTANPLLFNSFAALKNKYDFNSWSGSRIQW